MSQKSPASRRGSSQQGTTVPDRDQRVVLYTAAPGTPAYEALRLLRVVGTQDLTAGAAVGEQGD